MSPDEILRMLGLLGDASGDVLAAQITSWFDAAMWDIWAGALAILKGAFQLADQFSIFTVSTTDGPVGILWPMMLWISGVLALGLFFWQIVSTMLHGGRGFVRLVGGPVQYGVALAMTAGTVGVFLAAADGLTAGILSYGLHAGNFQDALHATSFEDAASDGVKAVAAALAGVVGVVPAGLGYVLEMLFREAAIYVLVATVPLTAAGLLANVTAVWFWRVVRWMLAAIAMKPVLALTLVLGIAIAGGAQGLSGLLAGVGVLLVSLCVPLVLFRLFAFADPNTDRGAAFRDQLGDAGLGSYGATSVAGRAGKAAWKKAFGGDDEDDEDDEDEGAEQANTDRFDRAFAEDEDAYGVRSEGAADVPGDHADGDSPPTGLDDTESDTDMGEAGEPSVPAPEDEPPPDTSHGDGDEDPPSTPSDGGDPTPPSPGDGPDSGGGGGGASDAEVEDAAVLA